MKDFFALKQENIFQFIYQQFCLQIGMTLGSFDSMFSNPFFAIEISFTLLLILELLSLIFVLHKSVVKSVGKQFELLSLLLLGAFIIVGFLDIKALTQTGKYLHSFHSFYTVLIFSDIIIVLIALRYTLNY